MQTIKQRKQEEERQKKDKEKQDYNRRERLNELLLIHPKSRTQTIENEITSLLVEFDCFHCVAEDNFKQLIEMSRQIYIECILPDTTIFN